MSGIMLKYEKGKIVTGQVTGIEKYGIFVSLDEFYIGSGACNMQHLP